MSSKILIIGILSLQIFSIQGQVARPTASPITLATRPTVPPKFPCCVYCLASQSTNSSSGLCCDCVKNITLPCDNLLAASIFGPRPIDGDEQCNVFLKQIYPKRIKCPDPPPCCQYCSESNVTISETGVCCNCVREITLPCDSRPPPIKGNALCNEYLTTTTQKYPRNVKCPLLF